MDLSLVKAHRLVSSQIVHTCVFTKTGTCVFRDCVYLSLSVDLQYSETDLTNKYSHTLVETKLEFKMTRAV